MFLPIVKNCNKCFSNFVAKTKKWLFFSHKLFQLVAMLLGSIHYSHVTDHLQSTKIKTYFNIVVPETDFQL